jgi:hypothetical protein
MERTSVSEIQGGSRAFVAYAMAIEASTLAVEEGFAFDRIAELHGIGSIHRQEPNVSQKGGEVGCRKIVRRHHCAGDAVADRVHYIGVRGTIGKLAGAEIYARHTRAVGVAFLAIRGVECCAAIDFELLVVLLHLLGAERERKREERQTENARRLKEMHTHTTPCSTSHR